MHRNRRISLFLVICLLCFPNIECKGSLNAVLREAIDSDFDSLRTIEYNSYDKSVAEKCSVNELVDKLVDNVVPNDYEFVDRDVIYEPIEHINETMMKIDRLQTLRLNVSNNLNPIIKQIVGRIMETVMTFDIENQCRNALVKINQALQNGESWAFRCKYAREFY